MAGDVSCWQCGASGPDVLIEMSYDASADISVPRCLDCRMGWTEAIMLATLYADSWRKTIAILTGREKRDGG